MSTAPQQEVRRVLMALADAARIRRSLPKKDPRRRSAQWVQPNWPPQLLIGPHQSKLLAMVLDEPSMRIEARKLLHLPSELPEVPAGLESDGLVTLLAGASDQGLVLSLAATHADIATAKAAAAILTGKVALPPQRPLPARQVRKLEVDDPTKAYRREIRQLRNSLRDAENALAAQVQECADVNRQLDQARTDLETAGVTVVQLRAQIPSKKQRRDLQIAGDQAAAVLKAQRKARTERTTHQAAVEAMQTRIVELTATIANTEGELATERLARQNLVAQMGDARARAQRLATMAGRELSDLRATTQIMRTGTELTRAKKRVGLLEHLLSTLNALYQIDAEPEETLSSVEVCVDTNAQSNPALNAVSPLAVTPVGGFDHIGGSCMLVETATTRIFVDVGLRPNVSLRQPGPLQILQHAEKPVDAIVITHAHADHAGFVPWLAGRHQNTTILCTPETSALLPTVWADSVRVMRAEADSTANWSEPVEPPYGDVDVESAEKARRPLPCGQTMKVGDISVTLFPVGHILGAAGVVLAHGGRRVVITGDIDDRPQASVGGARIPQKLAAGADLLIIESTYCDDRHNDREAEGATLIEQANQVLAAGGRVLIPAFGLGRAQEIALLVKNLLPGVRVLIDGLARDLTDLYELNGAPAVFDENITKVTDRTRQIQGFQNGIVITTSGMLTGGAAIPWAQAVLTDPLSALFLCGHQDAEAPGKELERLARLDINQPRTVTLKDNDGRSVVVTVSAQVFRYNLSAHADREGLMKVIGEVAPKEIMLVHGEPGPQRNFRAVLESQGRIVVDNHQTWNSEEKTSRPSGGIRRHRANLSRRGRSQ